MSNNSSNSSKGSGNTSQIPPSKKWCFTLNNYTESMISSIVPKFQQYCKQAFYSKEVGASGTPHLQGYMELLNKGRPLSGELFKNVPQMHWEKAKGSEEQNLKYITKDQPLDYCLCKAAL